MPRTSSPQSTGLRTWSEKWLSRFSLKMMNVSFGLACIP